MASEFPGEKSRVWSVASGCLASCLMTKILLLCSIFFQCLGNLGDVAEIFLHALSISKKYNMIAFLSLEGSEEEWR